MCLCIFFWFSWKFWFKIRPVYMQMSLSCCILILLPRFCCWFCPCLWLGAAAPSSLSAILILIYNPFILICCILFMFPLSIPDMINLLLSNLNLSQTLEFDDSLFPFSEAMSLTTRIFFFLSTTCLHEAAFSYFWNLNSSLVKFVKLIFLKSFIYWDLLLNFGILDKPPCCAQQCCMFHRVV